MSQFVGDGPAAHRGRVDLKIQAAVNFRGGEAVRSRRTSREQFAHERFNARGPIRGMVTT